MKIAKDQLVVRIARLANTRILKASLAVNLARVVATRTTMEPAVARLAAEDIIRTNQERPAAKHVQSAKQSPILGSQHVDTIARAVTFAQPEA